MYLLFDDGLSPTSPGATPPVSFPLNSAGPNYATRGDVSGSGDTWVDYATGINGAEDHTRTSCVLATGTSKFLICDTFGFALPEGAVPVGVRVEIFKQRVDNGGRCRDNRILLVVGGEIVGNNLALSDIWPTGDDPPTLQSNDYDLWGLTLTRAQVNAADFGVAIQAADPDMVDEADIDAVRMTVFYE